MTVTIKDVTSQLIDLSDCPPLVYTPGDQGMMSRLELVLLVGYPAPSNVTTLYLRKCVSITISSGVFSLWASSDECGIRALFIHARVQQKNR